jgi:hypothetical protein
MSLMIKNNSRKPEEASVEEEFSIVMQRLRRERSLCQNEVE